MKMIFALPIFTLSALAMSSCLWFSAAQASSDPKMSLEKELEATVYVSGSPVDLRRAGLNCKDCAASAFHGELNSTTKAVPNQAGSGVESDPAAAEK